MEKFVVPLLASADLGFISLSSTDGVSTLYPKGQTNYTGNHANVYLEASGFTDATGGLEIALYNSWDGHNWYLSTTLPSCDTATAVCYSWDNPGKFIIAKYSLGAVSVDNVRLMIELNTWE